MDNNLILLVAIGIVVFLIMNLNSDKSYKKSSRSPKSYDKNDKYDDNRYDDNRYDDNIHDDARYNNQYEDFEQVSAPVANQIKTVLTSSQPVVAGPVASPSMASPTDALNALYNSNLKGSPSPVGFASNPTSISGADFGQGFNLGINSTDPALAKFTSQAPPQKAPLISDDLLPKKSENWFETPSVGTKIDDANLLADAIFKTGVDTIGSTRKNPSYDMRGNIPNPKFPVSPWNNSSYEPDNNLRGLCF
jgi:hypothetical protein